MNEDRTIVEHVKTLAAVGKRDQVASALVDAAQMLEPVASIRADADFSDEYKARRITDMYVDARDRLVDRLGALVDREVLADRGDALQVFGVADLPGDGGALAISRRDAQDRVDRVSSPEELQALLARSTRSGDEVLARACAERALERKDLATLDQFVADRPDKLDAVQRMLDTAHPNRQDVIGLTWTWRALRPPEAAGTIPAVTSGGLR